MPDALETALLELREPPAPEFAAELDARVAAGFGAPSGRRRAPEPAAVKRAKRGPSRLRRLLLPAGGFAAAAALLFVVINVSGEVGGDASGGGSTSSGGSSAASGAAAPSADSGAGVTKPERAARLSGAAAVSPGKRNRKVERTAAVTLAAPPSRIEDAAAGISDIAGRFGGYVESSSVNARGAGGGGDFALRLPVSRLDSAMAALARVGKVTSRRQTSEDITGSHDQARSALGEARAERTSLLKRLAAAQTDAETASLRARLQDANGAIDRALTAVRQVNQRASYARVDVTLIARDRDDGATAPPAGDGSWGPGAAWSDARRVLEVSAGVLVLVLAVLGPLALVGLIGLGGRRLATARARSRVLDTV